MIRWGALAAACLLAAGCQDAEPSRAADVVLYVSVDEHVARDIIQSFEDETGLSVQFLTDTEAKKTTGLVERLRQEAKQPQADVFWSSEIALTIALADEGLLAPYESTATQDWPEQYRDVDRRWFAFAARPRVIVYSPSRLDAPPESWLDLTAPPWRDQIVMADPRFGTTGAHLGAMLSYWNALGLGEAYYEAWLEGLAANNTRLLPGGNAAVVDMVGRGEALVGMTDTDDVYAAQARGYDVAMVYPSHRSDGGIGSGTLLIPNTVALVAGARHPEAAGQLIDYLLSPATEQALAASASRNVPLNPALADTYSELRPKNPLRVDWADAAAARGRAVDLAMQWLRDDGEAGDDGS